jgi:hypothetical protein
LVDTDSAALAAPVASFEGELERMKLVQSRFQAIPAMKTTGADYAHQSAETETVDLKAALARAKVAGAEAERVCVEHQRTRKAIEDYQREHQEWKATARYVWDETGGHMTDPEGPEPRFPKIDVPRGLPREFALYLDGALAWHNPAIRGKALARAFWERILELPSNQRRYKSTWAAFMLGKAWEKEDPKKAVSYYQQVRELARRGLVDSAGLAAASLGLEARVYLKERNYEKAIQFYLEQMATGDPTAVNSLAFVAEEVLEKADAAALATLAASPRAQPVITAYVISRPVASWNIDLGPGEAGAPHYPDLSWLTAVESANVRDVQSAEKLALAAYQRNDMKVAQRWIRRAPAMPVSQWLQAKLYLRAGKLDQAATLLSQVTRAFPVVPPDTNHVARADLLDHLSMNSERDFDFVTAAQQALGELGALRLTRREFVQALDALLNAGFWTDAAYIAERVLAVDELKTYVDRHWPAASEQQIAEEKEKHGEHKVSPARLRRSIRYLLARRLTRSIRAEDAREYYPAEWLGSFELLCQSLTEGWDERLPAEQRARALFEAAIITRTNGMELIGTEVEPDWHLYLGDFEGSLTAANRAATSEARLLPASKDEIRRATAHQSDPETRFHYRYQAAALAWEAAKLLPDNSDDTARILWTAGCWLKARDPETADIFYKALVRRNRKTALGAEADRQRWFPKLDEDGRILPREELPGRINFLSPPPSPEFPEGLDDLDALPPVPSPEPDNIPQLEITPETQPPPGAFLRPTANGYEYFLHAGDSLRGLARACAEAGLPVSVKDLLEANPDLDPSRLRVGQKIFVPRPGR